jgi:hypothetical protein
MALRAARLSTREIARRIGIPTATVVALEHSAARARAPRPAEQLGRTVVFPVDVLDSLRPHAARRGISVNALARLIVSTVVDEDMVDAVMDDAADAENWVEA